MYIQIIVDIPKLKEEKGYKKGRLVFREGRVIWEASANLGWSKILNIPQTRFRIKRQEDIRPFFDCRWWGLIKTPSLQAIPVPLIKEMNISDDKTLFNVNKDPLDLKAVKRSCCIVPYPFLSYLINDPVSDFLTPFKR